MEKVVLDGVVEMIGGNREVELGEAGNSEGRTVLKERWCLKELKKDEYLWQVSIFIVSFRCIMQVHAQSRR
jgi:hypothetical protein